MGGGVRRLCALVQHTGPRSPSHSMAASAASAADDEVRTLRLEVQRLRQELQTLQLHSGATVPLGEVGPCSLDPVEYTAHRLTVAEREAFERDGFMVVKDVLTESAVHELRQMLASDRRRRVEAGQLDAGGTVKDAVFDPTHTLMSSPALRGLIAPVRLLPKVVDLMGWNIYIYHAQFFINPPLNAPHPPEPSGDRTYGFHQDTGRVNIELEMPGRPRLSVKVGYYFNGVQRPKMGNTWCLPGSHKVDTLVGLPDWAGRQSGKGQPVGPTGRAAVPLCCGPRDAVIFDRRTFHAASPNYSDVDRMAMFFGYSYRWLKPKDPMYTASLLDPISGVRCPIQRQMLGTSATNQGWTVPSDADAPLRGWLELHGMLEEGHAPVGYELRQDNGQSTRPSPWSSDLQPHTDRAYMGRLQAALRAQPND